HKYHRYRIPHQLVRKKLKREQTAFERIHHVAIAPEICEGLGDHAYAHPHLVMRTVVGMLVADCIRFEDATQPLPVETGADKEIGTRLCVHRLPARITHTA